MRCLRSKINISPTLFRWMLKECIKRYYIIVQVATQRKINFNAGKTHFFHWGDSVKLHFIYHYMYTHLHHMRVRGRGRLSAVYLLRERACVIRFLSFTRSLHTLTRYTHVLTPLRTPIITQDERGKLMNFNYTYTAVYYRLRSENKWPTIEFYTSSQIR